MACHKSFSISGVRGGKNSKETSSLGLTPSSNLRRAANALRVVMRHSLHLTYNDFFIYLFNWAQAPHSQKAAWAMPTAKGFMGSLTSDGRKIRREPREH